MTIYALSMDQASQVLLLLDCLVQTLKMLLKKLTKKMPRPRTAVLRKFNKINDNQLIDEGILWVSPNSYTEKIWRKFTSMEVRLLLVKFIIHYPNYQI